jgi:hypothetical protein
MAFNTLFGWIIRKRLHQIELFKKHPFGVQHELLLKLIHQAKQTLYGKNNNFNQIVDYNSFKQNAPLTNYDLLKPFIDKAISGEQNVLWPKKTKWFAKSSGTTNNRSKFLPVTTDSLQECHYKGGKDLLGIFYSQHSDPKLFNGKHLILGGNSELNELVADSYSGDLSAIIVKNLPWWAELKRTPSKEIALMSNWEEKIEKMAQATIKEDVHILAGVPSWMLVLCHRVIEITGKSNLLEVWPNLELYMHGGVNFSPYKATFQKLIPSENFSYIETYNASEGFFGIQDEANGDLLLMLDYGIFYEFIPMSDFSGVSSKEVVSLEDVVLNVNYALVITTNAGLWRYIIGDTIMFTSLLPFRFKITGRTSSFINAFGEELIVENAEKAVAMACEKTNSVVLDFHACPIYLNDNANARHQWVIDFLNLPFDIRLFKTILDESVRELNSDYDAKRSHDVLLKELDIIVLRKGVFNDWLKSLGKLGGQSKIPRLANDRVIMEQLLEVNKKKE